ncbi:MAG: hypothetical protein IIZ70_00410 [Kiritimatiellae bacterium]|nr:hypothetical protein [Kiritimatiellia bacterium]
MEGKSSLKACAAVVAVALAGCFTLTQSDYPAVQASKPGPVSAVHLTGFEATVTRFVPIYGYATVWNSTPGYYHRGHYHPGWTYPETVSTTSYIPDTRLTTAYVEKAQEAFESAGWTVGSTNATVVVDVAFSGPSVSDSDAVNEFFIMLFTAFTVDRTRDVWSARLKITDAASGKVLFMNRYEQEYTATVFGLVPIFSPLSADVVQGGYIKNWCLSALTDRAVADATAFLSSKPR